MKMNQEFRMQQMNNENKLMKIREESEVDKQNADYARAIREHVLSLCLPLNCFFLFPTTFILRVVSSPAPARLVIGLLESSPSTLRSTSDLVFESVIKIHGFRFSRTISKYGG